MKLTKSEFEKMIADNVAKSTAALMEKNAQLLERVCVLEKGGKSPIPPGADDSEPPLEPGTKGTQKGGHGFPAVQLKRENEFPEDKFSFVRLIRAHRTGDWKGAAFERHALDIGEQRAQTLGTASAGGYLVPQGFLPQEFVDTLRATEVIKPRCRVLENLIGSPVRIPRQTASGGIGWIAEDADTSADKDATFGEISLTPKIASARCRLTNMLLKNNPMFAESLIRDSLAKDMALGIDLAILRGTGADGQPTGINITSGVNHIDINAVGGPLTVALLKQMVYENALDNAVAANPCWFMHSRTKYTLSLLVDSGTSRPLIQPDITKADADTLLGYPVYVSNQIPINLTKSTGTALAEVYFCSDTKEAILGQWDAIEFDVTDIGGVNWVKWSTEVRAVAMVDVAVRHAQSFCTILDTTS